MHGGERRHDPPQEGHAALTEAAGRARREGDAVVGAVGEEDGHAHVVTVAVRLEVRDDVEAILRRLRKVEERATRASDARGRTGFAGRSGRLSLRAETGGRATRPPSSRRRPTPEYSECKASIAVAMRSIGTPRSFSRCARPASIAPASSRRVPSLSSHSSTAAASDSTAGSAPVCLPPGRPGRAISEGDGLGPGIAGKWSASA